MAARINVCAASLFWYDYETFGADPRRDRPAQFAGLRTDLDLNPIEKPLAFFCKPAPDYLPHPEACLLTGITPQQARAEGLPEVHFISRINDLFSRPDTCVLGYNNLRFDDEVTRNCLYRNLLEPYGREWRNGNSRWDLIDVARLAQALRPEGIEWPKDEIGRPTFRLEALTAANGIAHVGAHDALVDVYATIDLARLIRLRQPRLYHWAFEHRTKAKAAELLDLGNWQPVVHVSEKFGVAHNCLAIVVAVARHPGNPNGVVVYDLSIDPEPLLDLDTESLRRRLFTPVADLFDGEERLPLKTVHLNRCPALAPLKSLRPADIERLQLDLPRCFRYRDRLQRAPGLPAKVAEIVWASPPSSGNGDPDFMLYEGGFLSDFDRRTLERLHRLSPAETAGIAPVFEDGRLEEMWFRFRARNFPETLNGAEASRWEEWRVARLEGGGAGLGIREFEAALHFQESRDDLGKRERAIIGNLRDYLRELIP